MTITGIDALAALNAASAAATAELLDLDPDTHAGEATAAAAAAWAGELEELTADYAATIVRRLDAGDIDLADVTDLLARLLGTGIRTGALASLDITRARYRSTHAEALDLEVAIRAPSTGRQ